MTHPQRWAILAWIAGIAACAALISRTEIRADLAAFLPRAPTPAQQVLIEQLSEGVVSRLVLIGLEGENEKALAAASRRLAASLRAQPLFSSISNGELMGFERDRDFIWRNRYLLSDAVAPERFTAQALRASLEEDLQRLASPAGMLLRKILPGDPTGESIRLIERLGGDVQPAVQEGVWFSRDATRALLVAQTRAGGSDIDAQQAALAAITRAFSEVAEGTRTRLLVSGPGVFSVMARDRIESDALRYSLLATALVATMLLALYRSPRVLALGLLPVASGALAGVAAVSLGFGSVHGITLGFGVTLIGEGVDYPIYLFTQADPGAQSTFERLWPTLRLGVLTSICGFSAMLLSGFTGLAQLGLFSIVGLIVAALVTRWILPGLLPRGFVVPIVTGLAPRVMDWVSRAARLRYSVWLAVLLAAIYLAAYRGALWTDDLASLSPVSRADQRLDEELRRDLGAPDVRQLIVIHAADEQAALRESEVLAARLQHPMQQRSLEGFDSPGFYLPSLQAQRERQQSLPTPEVLRTRLHEALQGLPFRAGLFEPFLRDVEESRKLPLVDRRSVAGTHLALKLDSLLARSGEGWVAMMPLRGVSRPEAIAREISGPGQVLLDLKRESDTLYRGYRREALSHSLLGAAAIAVLLAFSLRSARRVFDVLVPLAAAVIVTMALQVAFEGELSIFHLVGLLLVVAVGSNYSLFFDRRVQSGRDRTLVSVMFASLSTVIAFGLLSLSKAPVLHALGSTVAMGAVMSVVFSAALSRRQHGR